MGDWDLDNGFEEPAQQGKKGPAAGGLHVILTAVCFLAVTAVSFGVSLLMKDRVRSFLAMGFTFAAPFAALMGSALLVEYRTNRMTPTCSRRAQVLFAMGTILAAFVIGCLAEVLHQPVVIEHTEPEYDYVIVMDKSSSMQDGNMDKISSEALHTLLDNMEDSCRVGFVAFGSEIDGQVEIRELDAEQRKALDRIIDLKSATGTDFSQAMDGAMQIIDRMEDKSRPVRVMLVTDGDEYALGNFDKFTKWAEKRNDDPSGQKVELCAIQLGNPMLDMVKRAVKDVSGQVYDRTDPAELAEKLGSLKSTLVIPEPVDTLKATFEGITADGKPNTPYVILTGVLMFLLGLLCGFSLMIMFSLHGQFRFQVILSALAGICAFLLLNYGRHLSISPAWICEGLAFSLFGLVFMRENCVNGGGKREKAKPAATGSFEVPDDF